MSISDFLTAGRVVLLVGNRDQHLEVLREAASRPRDAVLYERLISARAPAEAYDRLTHPASREHQGIVYQDQELSRVTFAQAMSIEREFTKARLVVHADAVPDADYL